MEETLGLCFNYYYIYKLMTDSDITKSGLLYKINTGKSSIL